MVVRKGMLLGFLAMLLLSGAAGCSSKPEGGVTNTDKPWPGRDTPGLPSNRLPPKPTAP
jgi:hypothetical protein